MDAAKEGEQRPQCAIERSHRTLAGDISEPQLAEHLVRVGLGLGALGDLAVCVHSIRRVDG